MILLDLNVPLSPFNMLVVKDWELRDHDQLDRWFIREKGETLITLGSVQILWSKARWKWAKVR